MIHLLNRAGAVIGQDKPLMKKKKLIITLALTGNVPTRERNKYAPLTSEEMVRDMVDCYEQGAAMAHIHARDENEQPTYKVEHFKKTLDLLTKTDCPIIPQLSTFSGLQFKDTDQRVQCLSLVPPSATLTCGSVNFPDAIYENSPSLIRLLAEKMYQMNIKPELEIFDTAMIENAMNLYREGLLRPPLHFHLILGIRGALPATPKSLFHCLDLLPPDCFWQVSVAGPALIEIATLVLALGGNIRVGVEDNIYYEKGVLATNVMHVERIAKMAKACGRELATPDEAREMLGLVN